MEEHTEIKLNGYNHHMYFKGENTIFMANLSSPCYLHPRTVASGPPPPSPAHQWPPTLVIGALDSSRNRKRDGTEV